MNHYRESNKNSNPALDIGSHPGPLKDISLLLSWSHSRVFSALSACLPQPRAAHAMSMFQSSRDSLPQQSASRLSSGTHRPFRIWLHAYLACPHSPPSGCDGCWYSSLHESHAAPLAGSPGLPTSESWHIPPVPSQPGSLPHDLPPQAEPRRPPSWHLSSAFQNGGSQRQVQ
jgi:hypothetical protein